MSVFKSYDLTCDERDNTSAQDRTYNRYWILQLMLFIGSCCVIVEVCLLWSPSTNIVSKLEEQIEGSRLRTPKAFNSTEKSVLDMLVELKQILHDQDLRIQKQQTEYLKRIDALTTQVQNEFNLTTVNGTRNSTIDTSSKQINIRDDKKIKNPERTIILAVKSWNENLLNSSSKIPESTEPSSTINSYTSKVDQETLKTTPRP